MPEKDSMPQVAQYWNHVSADFDAIYTGEGKSSLARALDHWLRKDMYQRFDWVMRESGDLGGRTVCDVGCGSGRFVVEFARRHADHVTGIDVAPEMLKLARALTAQQGSADRCEFVNTDVLDWTTDRVFDVTVAIGFWDYIQNPASRLAVIRRLTGRTFLSAWPRLWTWRVPLRKVRLQYVSGCPVYFYRKPHVLRLLEDAGFRVETCEAVGKLFLVKARPA